MREVTDISKNDKVAEVVIYPHYSTTIENQSKQIPLKLFQRIIKTIK